MTLTEGVYALAAAIEPTGKWATYGDVAEALDHPGAGRAVANILAGWNTDVMARIVRADGRSGGWRASQQQMPGHAERARRVAAAHVAAGLSAEPNTHPWPQDRRLSVTQLRTLLAAAR